MGLFSKKKKEKEEEKLREEFPTPPTLKFPEMSEIKKAIIKPLQPIQSVPPIQAVRAPQIEQPKAQLLVLPTDRMVREIDGGTIREPAIAKLKEPIFVKIDKFEDALSNFEEIKKRLHESFELLEKIKRIRGKEEEEIDAWEKEIEEIKAKMLDLDKKLFSRVEF